MTDYKRIESDIASDYIMNHSAKIFAEARKTSLEIEDPYLEDAVFNNEIRIKETHRYVTLALEQYHKALSAFLLEQKGLSLPELNELLQMVHTSSN